MPTSYPGREHEHDLGNGSSFVWMAAPDGTAYGLIEHHPPSPEHAAKGSLYCGGYIAWTAPDGDTVTTAKHQLVAGGPGDEQHLTISPSLLCRTCGNHGWIRDGAWQPA